MASRRLEYIDAARGLTMFLVVAQHITTFWGSIGAYEHSVLNQTLRTFRMPLFFFISGFIAYKSSEFWDLSFFKQRFVTKARVQLIPAITFSFLFYLCYGGNILDHLFGFFWFTPALFGVFCIYFSCCFLLRKHPRALDWVLSLIVVGATILSFPILGHKIHSVQDNSLISLIGKIFYHLGFFVAGHFVHKYKTQAFSLLANEWVNFSLIIVFITSMLLILPNTKLSLGNQFPYLSMILRSGVVRYAGLFVVFSFFVRRSDYFARNSHLSRTMQHIGRHTLDIYMLQNFFLSMPLDTIRTIVIEASKNVVTQIMVESLFAIVVICICLLISSILRNSNFLAYYLFGAKRKNGLCV